MEPPVAPIFFIKIMGLVQTIRAKSISLLVSIHKNFEIFKISLTAAQSSQRTQNSRKRSTNYSNYIRVNSLTLLPPRKFGSIRDNS